MINNVDFLVHTQDNKEGLEQLIVSIAEHYPGANITIADSSKELYRVGYKELNALAIKGGLLNRIRAHHVGHNAGISTIWQRMFMQTPRKYKLTLNDSMLFTEHTDIDAMVELMENVPKVGIVNGVDEFNEENTEAEHLALFALHRKELYHTHHWHSPEPYTELFNFFTKRTTWHIYNCGQAVISSSIIENETKEDTTEPEGGSGASDREATQPNVQSDDSREPEGSAVLPSGQAEEVKPKRTGRRPRKGWAWPLRRALHKQNYLPFKIKLWTTKLKGKLTSQQPSQRLLRKLPRKWQSLKTSKLRQSKHL